MSGVGIALTFLDSSIQEPSFKLLPSHLQNGSVPTRPRLPKPLLTVLGQNPITGAAEPGAMLLETAQNNLIALVDHRPAQARDIASAGVMALLCQGRRNEENKRQNEENPGHPMAPFFVFSRDQIPPRQRCQCAKAGNSGARQPSRAPQEADTERARRQGNGAGVGRSLTTISHK